MDYWILGSGFLHAYLGVMFGLGANFCMSVDFGTSNTLVFLRDEGVVVNQASLLALRTDKEKPNSFQIFDAGNDVSPLVGRTAPQIYIESPLCSGVMLTRRLGIQVRCVEDPLCAVIAGNGRVVNEPELHSLCRR